MKNKSLLLISSMVCTVIFSGCGAKGQQFTQFNQPKLDKGMLYVYRPSSFLGGGVFYDVHNTNQQNNDLVIGELRNGGYIEAEVSVGENEIWGQTEAKSSVTIDIKKGETYCVKGGVGIGLLVGRPHLSIVDLNTCKAEILETRKAQ